MTTEHPHTPFDENAALEELERLREQIRLARARREQKVEEFEAWVRTNRNAARAERIAAIEQETASAASASGARAANRASDHRAQTSAAAAARQQPGARGDSEWKRLQETRPAISWQQTIAPWLTRNAAYYAAGAVAIGAIALALIWSDSGSREPQSAAGTPAAAAAGPSAPSSGSEGTGSAAPAGPARALEIELNTTRPVWMRVIVDGERRVEREVSAGQRLTFGADRAIVLRVGDGGGVRLKVGGRDEGFLGRDGQIAARTLTAKQP